MLTPHLLTDGVITYMVGEQVVCGLVFIQHHIRGGVVIL